jgi:hypothetical protein
MYHPSQPSDVEFVELQNVGSEPLNLDGVRFGGGIEFTFPALMLEPNEFVVVVEDVPRFIAQYGGGRNVAGAYSGRLSNGGDDLVLQLPAPYDAAILRFEYRDDWYPQTDGGGVSLEVRDVRQDDRAWSEADGWQAGTIPTGTPGTDRAIAAGDMNGDGRVDFDDVNPFALGMNDALEYESVFSVPAALGGDMDHNGILDFDDIDDFSARLGHSAPPVPGDMDRNGQLDFDDLDDFFLALGDPQAYEAIFGVPGWFAGDLDDNGQLDFDDLDDLTALLGASE